MLAPKFDIRNTDVREVPIFPEFRSITPCDKVLVSKFTVDLPPYSDFNFTSLYCWDVSGDFRIAQLHGNLIVRFTDYITGKAFYSFCGTSSATETAASLLDHARRVNISPVLKLLPPESVENLRHDRFEILEDRDNFDYVLTVAEMCSFEGASLHGQRGFVRRFQRQNKASTRELDLSCNSVRHQVESLLTQWVRAKQRSAEEISIELSALRRFFDLYTMSECVALGVFVEETLVGFSIVEMIDESYAMFHFEKGNTEVTGIYPYLMRETALRVADHGCTYINYQQDLGIIWLRRAKSSYKPCAYLKKFTVVERSL